MGMLYNCIGYHEFLLDLHLYKSITEAYIYPSFIYSWNRHFQRKNHPPGDDKRRQEEAARLLSRSALEDLGEWFQPAGAVTSSCRYDIRMVGDPLLNWLILFLLLNSIESLGFGRCVFFTLPIESFSDSFFNFFLFSRVVGATSSDVPRPTRVSRFVYKYPTTTTPTGRICLLAWEDFVPLGGSSQLVSG